MPVLITPGARPAIFKDKDFKTAFKVTELSAKDVNEDTLAAFLDGRESDILGCSATFLDQRLQTLTLATSRKVLHIQLGDRKLEALERHVVQNGDLVIVGCNLDRVAFGLYTDAHETRVSNFVDLISLHGRPERTALSSYLLVLGGETTLHVPAVTAIFGDVPDEEDSTDRSALRAWACCKSADMGLTRLKLDEAKRLSTSRLPPNDVRMLAKIHRDAALLDGVKPKTVKNEIAEHWSLNDKGDTLRVTSERFATRLRQTGERQVVQITDENDMIIEGVVFKTQGRTALITLPEGSTVSTIQGLHTIGKDALTQAERMKEIILLKALEGVINVSRLKTFRAIWFPAFGTTGRPRALPADAITVQLNDSQKQAVTAVMREPLKNAVDVQIIVGPPGSGKTSVIGASVQALMASATVEQPRYVWLAAQSNVAVKNIARKLVDINFLDFRLLVSNEFFFDWHEHLYLRVQKHMIPAKEFPKGTDAAAELLDGVRVILCTLSMLSHMKLPPFTSVVPVETLIVDEASQIELGDFVPVLCNYSETIRKLVFVGDDKQLAPFGQDDIPDLKSVFEIDQLRRKAVFLNTQYRMPMAIGQFISNEIYKGQLRSQHADDSRDACRFVDVPLGREEERGHSWANIEECKAAVDVARILHAEEKDFRIITPYDGQRSEVETALKQAQLPWEERVFNVDSFQGNEAPYIILTVVRTQRVGFLKNERRTNVMLSRCQQGLIIVCNRDFLSGFPARTTLVGRMAAEWGDGAWVGARRVANGSLEPGEDPETDEPAAPADHEAGPSLNDWGGAPDADWSTSDAATAENDWSLPAEDWSIAPPAAEAGPPPGLGKAKGKGQDKTRGRKNKNRGRSPPAAYGTSSQSNGAPEGDRWDAPATPVESSSATGWDDSGWDIPPAAAAAAAAAAAKEKEESTWDAPAGPSTAGWDDSGWDVPDNRSVGTSGADVDSNWSSTGSNRGRGRGRGKGRGRGRGRGGPSGDGGYRRGGRDRGVKHLDNGW